MILEVVYHFLLKYKYIILFYILIIGFFYRNRKNVELQAKIVALYRTKFGLKLMDKWAEKYREWLRVIGYIGVGIGYLGLISISILLVKSIYDLLFVPSTQAGAVLALPGVNIPGFGVLPFSFWIISIFFIMIIHEFSHGIIARTHNIKVKSSGLVLFGPILGAFVEPDEKQMNKMQDVVQYSVFAAGPVSNIITGVIALFLLTSLITPLYLGMTMPVNFIYGGNDYGENVQILTSINNSEIMFNSTLKDLSLSERTQFGVTTVLKPKPKYAGGFGKLLLDIVLWFKEFFKWFFLLSIGIGWFNLLPISILDGGRMTQITLREVKGKNKGNLLWRKVSLFFIIVLLLNLFLPYITKIF